MRWPARGGPVAALPLAAAVLLSAVPGRADDLVVSSPALDGVIETGLRMMQLRATVRTNLRTAEARETPSGAAALRGRPASANTTDIPVVLGGLSTEPAMELPPVEEISSEEPSDANGTTALNPDAPGAVDGISANFAEASGPPEPSGESAGLAEAGVGSAPSGGALNEANLTEETNASMEAMAALGKAVVGGKLCTHISDGLCNESSAESNVSEAAGGNETLQHVIAKEAYDAITNKTVREKGEKAMVKKIQGKKTLSHENFDKKVKGEASNASVEEELKNETIQKAITDRVKEAIDEKVAEDVAVKHRLPSSKELNKTVEEELRNIWYDLVRARRLRKGTARSLKSTASAIEWGCLVMAMVAFVLGNRHLLKQGRAASYRGPMTVAWVVLAALNFLLVYFHMSSESGTVWLIGYLLEFIFAIENIFVFHIIVKAFRMRESVTEKLLFYVVLFQTFFQIIFYMGLGPWLRSIKVLPYFLGIWLLYVGIQAATEDDHAGFDIMQSRFVLTLQSCLGNRLELTRDNHHSCFTEKDGKTCLSPVGLLLLCLLIADFLLEVDVTVTKITSFPSRYLCLSSSVLASFTVPEMFFFARELFGRFFGLKYGISFVLMFVGAQALLHDFFTLRAVASVGIIVAVIAMSIIFSCLFKMGKGDRGDGSDD